MQHVQETIAALMAHVVSLRQQAAARQPVDQLVAATLQRLAARPAPQDRTRLIDVKAVDKPQQFKNTEAELLTWTRKLE